MKKIFLFASLCLSFFAVCCSGQEPDLKYLREIAGTRVKVPGNDPETALTVYAESSGMKLGDMTQFAARNPMFVIASCGAKAPDASLIVEALFQIQLGSSMNVTKTNSGNKVITTTTEKQKFKILQLDLSRTVTEVNDGESEVSSIRDCVYHSGKLIYSSVCASNKNDGAPEISTDVDARQLLSLLQENCLEVKVIAYAEAGESKGALFSLRFVKK